MNRAFSVLLLVCFAVTGTYLFTRALNGAGPLAYFFSAVAFGMAIATVQSLTRGGRR